MGGVASVKHAKTRAAVLLVIATLLQLPLQKAHKSIVFTNEGVQPQLGRHVININRSAGTGVGTSTGTGIGTGDYGSGADSGADSGSDDDEAPQAIPVSRQVLRHLLHLFLACGNLTSDDLTLAASAESSSPGAVIPAANISGLRRVSVLDPAARQNAMLEGAASSSDDEKGSGAGSAMRSMQGLAGQGQGQGEGSAHASVILIRSKQAGASLGSSSAATEIYLMLGQLLGLLRGYAGKEPAVLRCSHSLRLHAHKHSQHRTQAEAVEMHLHGHSLSQAQTVSALLGTSKHRVQGRARLQRARDLANMGDASVFDYAMQALM